ncbi:portal protein, partial [bacterium]|nr:portal protein [bacterium]
MQSHPLGSVTDLLKRFKSAQKHYEEFRSLHQETYDFVAPQRETFRFHSAGQEKNRHVFDSTAVSGLEKFASRIKGSTLPSWKQWFKLEAGSIVPE